MKFLLKVIILEVNIFGIKKNLYNKNIYVIFNKFIRPEKKFKNIIELKKFLEVRLFPLNLVMSMIILKKLF